MTEITRTARILALCVALMAFTLPAARPAVACDVRAIDIDARNGTVPSELTGTTLSWESPWDFGAFTRVPGCEGGMYETLTLDATSGAGRATSLRVLISRIGLGNRGDGAGWGAATNQLEPGTEVLLSEQEGTGWAFLATQGNGAETIAYVAVTTTFDHVHDVAVSHTVILTSREPGALASSLEALDDDVGIPGFEPFAIAPRNEVYMAILGA